MCAPYLCMARPPPRTYVYVKTVYVLYVAGHRATYLRRITHTEACAVAYTTLWRTLTGCGRRTHMAYNMWGCILLLSNWIIPGKRFFVEYQTDNLRKSNLFSFREHWSRAKRSWILHRMVLDKNVLWTLGSCGTDSLDLKPAAFRDFSLYAYLPTLLNIVYVLVCK